jgi:DMSO reductase anchor subunit
MIQLSSRKNRYRWKAAAAANFFLGGMGSGLFILDRLISVQGQPAGNPAVAVISAALVVCGFGAVAFEAGRPLRGVYVVLNFATAWMSREVIFGGLFAVLCLIHHFLGLKFPGYLAALCAGLLILSQAMVLYRSTAVATWQTVLIPALLITADLCAGYGAGLLLGPVSTPLVICGLSMTGAHILLSTIYQLRIGSAVGIPAGSKTGMLTRLLRQDAAGLWIPFCLSLFLLADRSGGNRSIAVVCGLFAVLGTGYKIFSIVCRSIHFTPMTIENPLPESSYR